LAREIEATYRDFCLWFNKQRAAGRISPAADRAAYFIKLGLWALAYDNMPPRSLIDGLAGDVETLERELRRQYDHENEPRSGGPNPFAELLRDK
jgi:hypothetical protein